MKTILIFDCETTGLPGKGKNYEFDYMEFPYIVQLAWKFTRKDKVKNFIIKPEGYKIPEDVIKLHGITTKYALSEGDYFENVIRKFIDDCLFSDIIVGHNIHFDTSMIKANVLRLLKGSGKYTMPDNYITIMANALDKSKRVDTMMKTIKFCNFCIPGSKRLKFPKLSELYFKLFGEEMTGAHNAVNDILATERCYLELLNRKLI